MKKGLIYIFLGLSCLLSCTSDDSCTSGGIPVITLSDIGCTNSERLVSVNSPNELELIRDQEGFDAIITAPCQLNIDWQQYDLIIGTVRLSQGFIGLKNSAVFDCVENRIEMTVEIALSNTTEAPSITWSFLIPKNTNFFIRPLRFD